MVGQDQGHAGRHRQGLIVDSRPGRIVTLDPNPVDEAPFRVLSAGFDTPLGPVVVVVGGTVEDVAHTVQVTSLTLAGGLPALVLLAAVTTWVMVGRALGPVEAIRSEVTAIGATDLHRRVPVPPGDDEIARLAGTMNEMLDRVESGTRRQRRFVSDASHELRTPIATVRHELEVALAHPAATDWPALAAEVLEEDLRMQRLVEDLLWLARHDGHRAGGAPALVDLDEVVLEQIRRRPPRAGIAIVASGVGAGQVRGRADDLTRVVQNLLDNALRHAASQVAVSLRSHSGGVVLDVDDDGPGVAAGMDRAIFQRFTRSDEARGRDEGGAGLGLAIVAEIVAEHGGGVEVGTAPLGGARFTVRLADARLE